MQDSKLTSTLIEKASKLSAGEKVSSTMTLLRVFSLLQMIFRRTLSMMKTAVQTFQSIW